MITKKVTSIQNQISLREAKIFLFATDIISKIKKYAKNIVNTIIISLL